MATKFTGTILKTDAIDSNGRSYSKEAVEKAINEYMEKYPNNKLHLDNKGSVSFDISDECDE